MHRITQQEAEKEMIKINKRLSGFSPLNLLCCELMSLTIFFKQDIK
jgi:hypothetical protein